MTEMLPLTVVQAVCRARKIIADFFQYLDPPIKFLTLIKVLFMS